MNSFYFFSYLFRFVHFFLKFAPMGQRPHLAHDFAKQSVVCYTLCLHCRENAVAAGEGKGI